MRKKIKLTWIKNEAQRKQSFKKRKSGLVKKVKELTTLCGVSAFIVIHGPGEDSPTVWPSPEVAHLLIQRFRTVPEMERCRKMVNQEGYLRERATKMREQLQKLFRRNKENVTSYVMHEFSEGKPLSQFTMTELGSVLWLLEEKMKEIKRRLEFYRQPHRYYDRDDQGGNSASFTLPPPTTEEMTGRQEFPWEWFFGSPLGLQPMDSNGYNFLGGSLASSSGGGSGSRGDGGAGSSSLRAYGDFFRVGNNNDGNEVNSANVGFQPYRNNTSLGFSEGVNNNNVSVNGGNNEVGLGFGYFGGGSTSTNVTTNIVGGMSVKDLDLAPQVNSEGMTNNGGNQEMGFGGALQNPSYGHNNGFGGNSENLGFGLQSGQASLGGNINNNGVNIINFNCINAGNDAGHGVLGQAQENNIQGDVNNGVLNNGYVGSEIGAQSSSELLFPGNTSNGNQNGGNDAAAENSSDDFSKYWSGFF